MRMDQSKVGIRRDGTVVKTHPGICDAEGCGKTVGKKYRKCKKGRGCNKPTKESLLADRMAKPTKDKRKAEQNTKLAVHCNLEDADQLKVCMTAVRAVVPSTLQPMSEDRKELARKSLREAEALWQRYNITPLPPLSAFERLFKVVCMSPEERETAIDKAKTYKSQEQKSANLQGYEDDDKSTATSKMTMVRPQCAPAASQAFLRNLLILSKK